MSSQEIYSRFTVAELKEKLRKRQLATNVVTATNGVKAELIVRLMEADPSGDWANEQDELDNTREEYPEEGAVGGVGEQQGGAVENQQRTHDWLLKEVEFM